MKNVTPSKQSGVSMIETIIIFPIVLMIALWIIHIGLVYQARANLEYAALMGARVGAVTNIDIGRMREEIARRLAPSQVGAESD
jgi:Flp pilus assembly protein TadG